MRSMREGDDSKISCGLLNIAKNSFNPPLILSISILECLSTCKEVKPCKELHVKRSSQQEECQ